MNGPFYREEAKRYYRNRENIEKKWLDRFGSVSRDNDYQRNRECLAEVFNMLDIVMDICIEDFRKTHRIVAIEIEGKTPVYTFALADEESRTNGGYGEGETVSFSMPGNFARRVKVLRMIGYDLSDELFYDTRYLRNETAHGNQTIILQNMKIGYDETMKAMRTISDALIILGKLPESMRSPSFEMMRVREGDTLLGGVYTIGPFLGEGGMSRVYEASQKRSRRRLAVKEFKPGIRPEEAVRRESEILSGLHHERIPQVCDAFSENGTYYIVMQYIDGTALDGCEARRRLTDDDKLAVTDGICDILRYLYSAEGGLLAADLSPSNILVDDRKQAYLLDPGVREEGTGAAGAGTPAYCAPEVLAGKKQDERSDIYSLGCILWFLYTGRSPAEMDRISDEEFAKTLPPGAIQEIIRVCTQRNPGERYQSLEEFRQALASARASLGKEPEKARAGEEKAPGTRAREEEKKAPAARAQAEKEKAPGTGRLSGAKRWILPAVVLAAVLIVCALAYTGAFTGKRPEKDGRVTASMPEDHVMVFEDPMLELEIRNMTGIDSGEIMLSDVWALRELSLSGCGIKDISALGELKNLEYLDLSANQITDISALSSLDGLRELLLEGNEIRDPRPLSGLTKLEKLDVGNNRIDSPAFLENMGNLRELAAGNNPVSGEDIKDALTGRSLQSLNLCGLGLTDCAWIGSMSGLKALYLSDNRISDITPLANLTDLTALYLENNGISDILALSSLSDLEELDLQHNPVGSLEPIRGLSKITWLDVRDCGLPDLSPAASMKMLVSVDASSNQIADLSPLSGLVRLSYLDVSNNALSGGVEPLAGLKALTYLDIRQNEIRDISALKGLSALRRLYLSGNPIEDLSVLDSLNLEEIRE